MALTTELGLWRRCMKLERIYSLEPGGWLEQIMYTAGAGKAVHCVSARYVTARCCSTANAQRPRNAVGKVQAAPSSRQKIVHVGETLTDLQILGCELHKNAFGGRATPGPAEGAIALSQTP